MTTETAQRTYRIRRTTLYEFRAPETFSYEVNASSHEDALYKAVDRYLKLPEVKEGHSLLKPEPITVIYLVL